VDRQSCVFGLRMVTPWRRSLSGHSFLQRVAASTWHSAGDDGAVLGGLSLASLPRRDGVAFVGCVCCVRCSCGGVVSFGS
jgi:hypothetical protein